MHFFRNVNGPISPSKSIHGIRDSQHPRGALIPSAGAQVRLGDERSWVGLFLHGQNDHQPGHESGERQIQRGRGDFWEPFWTEEQR